MATISLNSLISEDQRKRLDPKRLQLGVRFIGDNGAIDYQILNLDIINNVNVRLDSELSEHPTLEGDTIADHMWSKPESIDISGVFSQQGRYGLEYLTEGFLRDNRYSRVENIQTLYERIKEEALEIDILSVFKRRERVVLTGITWNERANSISYSFSFKKIRKASFQEIINEPDPLEVGLPFLDDVVRTYVIDSLIMTDDIWYMVLNILNEYKLVNDKLLAGQIIGGVVFGAVGLGASSLVVVGAVALIKALLATGALAQAIPVAGQVVGAALVIIAAITYGVIRFISWMDSKKYKIKAFGKKDQERLDDFKEDILNNVREIEKYSSVYLINQNREQEFSINFNNKDYIFRVTHNEMTAEWTLKVTKFGALGEETVIPPTVLSPLAGLGEARDNPGSNLAGGRETDLFIYCIYSDREYLSDSNLQKVIDDTEVTDSYLDTTAEKVLLIDPKFQNSVMRKSYINSLSKVEKLRLCLTGSAEGMILDSGNLRNFSLFISSRSVDNFFDALDQIIKNAIVK